MDNQQRAIKRLIKEFPFLPLKFMVSNELAADFDYTLHDLEKVQHEWIAVEDERVWVGFNEIKEELENMHNRDFTDDEVASYATECILIYTSPQ